MVSELVYTEWMCLCCLLDLKEGFLLTKFEPRHEKTNILVSDLVRHKPGCTATKDG